LKEPLKSILAVPIIYEDQIIGVVEVYNKVSPGTRLKKASARKTRRFYAACLSTSALL